MPGSAHNRLVHTLLLEMVSGAYSSGERFLSHRRIMQRWTVSTPTVNLALRALQQHGLLAVSDRSGCYLTEDFRDRALFLLTQEEMQKSGEPVVRNIPWVLKVISDSAGNGEGITNLAVAIFIDEAFPAELPMEDGPPRYEVGALLAAREIISLAASEACSVELHICDGTTEGKERLLALLLEQKPHGVIIIRRTYSHPVADIANELLRRLIPVVTIYDDCEGTEMLAINFNNLGMGTRVAERFIQSGHRNLAVVLPVGAKTTMLERLKGFEMVAAETSGIEVSVFYMDMEVADEEAGRVVAQIKALGVTALFSVGHALVDKLLPEMHSIGITVPESLSIVSCSCTPVVNAPPAQVDIMFMDFAGLGQIALKAISDLRSRKAGRKFQLVEPQIQSFGSVQSGPAAQCGEDRQE